MGAWLNIIRGYLWGNLGEKISLEGQNIFKTLVLDKNSNFQITLEGFLFDSKTFPNKCYRDYNLETSNKILHIVNYFGSPEHQMKKLCFGPKKGRSLGKRMFLTP